MSDTPRADQLEADYFGSPGPNEWRGLVHALEREIRALRDELYQSKAPVIGECEDCGHKIVTPLGRLL